MGRRTASELGPTLIADGRIDAVQHLVPKGVHARALSGSVLGLVDLRRFGIREDTGAGRAFDHHGDAGILRRRELTRHLTDTKQGVPSVPSLTKNCVRARRLS